MLRRRLSTSLLNAQALLQTPAARVAVPPVPALPAQFAGSSRGLASAMLLSSKENWSSKTVKNLKEALAQRGLSQTGKKASLIERLTEYDSARTPSPFTTRGISSSAAPQAESKEPADLQAETSKVEVQSDAEVNTINLAEIETAEVEPALAPGLPEAKTDFDEAPPTLEIKMPEFEDEAPEFAVPPFAPDNFASKAEDSISPPAEVQDMTPKVMTVTPPTEGEAGPRHSLHETVAADEIEVKDTNTALDAAKEAASDLPSLGSVLSSISLPTFGLGSLISNIKVPEVNSKDTEFKPIERGLNGEEKTGAFILAGIVAAGLFLGGGKREEEEQDVSEKVNEAATKAAH